MIHTWNQILPIKKNATTHSSRIQRARTRTGRSCLLLRRKTVAGALATAMSAASRAIRAALFGGAIDALRGGALSSRRRPWRHWPPSHGCYYVTDDKPVPLTKFESIYRPPAHHRRRRKGESPSQEPPPPPSVRTRVALADFFCAQHTPLNGPAAASS